MSRPAARRKSSTTRATSVWAGIVAATDVAGAHFCEDCHVAEIMEGAGVRAWIPEIERLIVNNNRKRQTPADRL